MFNRTTACILVAALAAAPRPVGRAALVRPPPPPPAPQTAGGAPVRRSRARCPPSRCSSPTARSWCRANCRGTGRWCSSASPIARTCARPRWRELAQAQKQWAALPDSIRPRVLFVSVDPERDTPRSHRRIRARLPPRHARRHRRRPGARSLRAQSLSLVFMKVPPPEGAPADQYSVDHSADARRARSAGPHGRRDPAAAGAARRSPPT